MSLTGLHMTGHNQYGRSSDIFVLVLTVGCQIYIDAHNPSRSISWNQARTIIRQLIKGLRNAGLQNGDCVAVHSLNNVRTESIPGTL